MTDMTNSKKNKIRFTAKAFAREVQGAPFDSGLSIHQNTIDQLYDGSARIRLCLKCGAIESTTKLKKENHSCAYSFKSFQVLVTTSWKKLEDFFLSDKYIEALKEIGVEIGVREVPTAIVETKDETPAAIPEMETADVSVAEK
jgi:hypothetical protein